MVALHSQTCYASNTRVIKLQPHDDTVLHMKRVEWALFVGTRCQSSLRAWCYFERKTLRRKTHITNFGALYLVFISPSSWHVAPQAPSRVSLQSNTQPPSMRCAQFVRDDFNKFFLTQPFFCEMLSLILRILVSITSVIQHTTSTQAPCVLRILSQSVTAMANAQCY